MISRLIDFALVVLQLLMFKFCGIIGISKVQFFNFSWTERVKQYKLEIPEQQTLLQRLILRLKTKIYQETFTRKPLICGKKNLQSVAFHVLHEKVSLEILHNSEENTCARVSLSIKLAQVLSCKFCETSRNTFFTEHLCANTSANSIQS